MLRNTAIALAAAASLMLGSGALTPALAQPKAKGHPTYAAPALNQHAASRHANNRRAAADYSPSRARQASSKSLAMSAWPNSSQKKNGEAQRHTPDMIISILTTILDELPRSPASLPHRTVRVLKLSLVSAIDTIVTERSSRMWGNPKDYRERARRYFEMASETSDFVLKESLIDYAERWLRMAVELEYAHDRVSQRHQKHEKIAV